MNRRDFYISAVEPIYQPIDKQQDQAVKRFQNWIRSRHGGRLPDDGGSLKEVGFDHVAKVSTDRFIPSVRDLDGAPETIAASLAKKGSKIRVN